MSSLGTILNSIVLKGENNFCCLCFKNYDQNTNIYEELSQKLSLEIKETGQNIVAVTDILQSIFGNGIQEYISTFEKVCENCLKSIINTYLFIKTCSSNAMLLMKTLDGLYNSFQYTEDEKGNSKSLFVSLNLEDFVSKHLYDDEKLNSSKAALTRFKLINMPKTKKIYIKKEKLHKTSKEKENTVHIKISDMLLDPNDQLDRKCKVCFKAYPSMWTLKSHFVRDHAPKDYKCPECPKAFGSPSLVTYHKNVNHCEIICSECGKTFKNRTTLVRHEMGHNLKLVCPDCGRTYKSRVTYKKHIELNVCKRKCRADPANAQYTCDYCGKKYTQKISLRVHIQYDHGNYKSHVCKWCGKKFWAQSRLKTHIVKHTREKKFTCSICEGKFVSKESLLYHTRLHTGEKPYKCSECGSTFVSASRRAYHMKTYHLLAMVECDVCHSKFTSHLYLDKHKRSHKQPKQPNFSQSNKIVKPKVN